jgi:hypothetical protein
MGIPFERRFDCDALLNYEGSKDVPDSGNDVESYLKGIKSRMPFPSRYPRMADKSVQQESLLRVPSWITSDVSS